MVSAAAQAGSTASSIGAFGLRLHRSETFSLHDRSPWKRTISRGFVDLLELALVLCTTRRCIERLIGCSRSCRCARPQA